jgi:hypothetical protein
MQPDAGALSLDGVLIDKPHLTQARRTLGLEGRAQAGLLAQRRPARQPRGRARSR